MNATFPLIRSTDRHNFPNPDCRVAVDGAAAKSPVCISDTVPGTAERVDSVFRGDGGRKSAPQSSNSPEGRVALRRLRFCVAAGCWAAVSMLSCSLLSCSLWHNKLRNPRRNRHRSTARCSTGSSALRGTASRRWSAFRATPIFTTRALRPGGVWKSWDGGEQWYPIFDGEDAQSIGSIALAPSNPNIVWVGTGEAVHSQQRLARQRDLQIDRRRQNLEAHGAGKDRPHRPHPDRSREPRHCLRRGPWHLLWAAAGARRLSHDRWRRHLEARPVRR